MGGAEVSKRYFDAIVRNKKWRNREQNARFFLKFVFDQSINLHTVMNIPSIFWAVPAASVVGVVVAGLFLLWVTVPATAEAMHMANSFKRAKGWSQLTRIVLQPADDATRARILRLRAERRGILFDEAAIDWLLKRVGRDLGSLTRLFEMLDRESLAAQRRLTVPFLRQLLGG